MPSFNRPVLPLCCAVIALTVPRAVVAADEGEKVYQDSCTSCHNAKSHPLEAVHLSRQQWKDAVERMEGMGTEVPSGKKLAALLDYLERTHGADGGSTAEKNAEKK